ncbi:rRNA biogenesis protein rrp36 [Arthrobotrys musiformis]|uniref:rRNA biogenesis protein RRP36 n=1 Tax=Arthrobotrys musiformis TaxID=47236 RepID=A0AAV9WEL6_9PEZI
MVNKRVQVRYEDSDVEDEINNWSDDSEDASDADSDAPSEEPAEKSRSRGGTTRKPAEEESGDDWSEEDDNGSGSESGEGEDSGEEEGGEYVTADIATISFGALAKAQRSLKRKRDEPEDDISDQSDSKPKLSNGRDPRNAARLAEIKGRMQALPADSKSSFAESLRKAREKRKGQESQDSRSKRSSKHAPTEMSSKKAVSRRRIVVDMPADTTRDPRFDQIGQSGAVNMDKIAKNYDFLEDYRESEIKSLRQEAAKEKNPIRKQEMENTLKSLESKRDARKRRLEHDKILAEHKKKEREAIKQGKKPFYLKKSEQKKLVLTTQFANMGEKQRSRVIEKKRKKIASKEKKRMPWSRRTATGPED